MFYAITRRVSLVTGLILFAFAATHFANHAVGLFNLETMDQIQVWRLTLTRSLAGTIILGAALILHVASALLKLAARRTLRLPAWELSQLILGLAIPFLLLPHIVDTRIAWTLLGVQDNYLYELSRLWPSGAFTQTALLLVVWVHGCLGIHHWLKFRAWYRMLQAPLLLVALALPLAALTGFVVSGRAVANLMSDRAIAEQMRALTHWPNEQAESDLTSYQLIARAVFAALLVLAGAWFLLRRIAMLAAARVEVSYAGGPSVRSALGPTLLEISRANGIAHAAACGGRARCGTCRVRIDEGMSALPLASAMERATLGRIKADANVRLACQLRPATPLVVTRLVRAAESIDVVAPSAEATDDAGVQRSLYLFHLQLRDLNEITRGRLPYDVVFILNEFFQAAGAAVEQNFGRVDRFLGDGLLAVFGEQRTPAEACKDALGAARAIDASLDRLNEKVAAEIGRKVAISIGIHAGTFVCGRIGIGKSSVVSVVGAGTDLPRRIAGLAEAMGWQIALSRAAAEHAMVRDFSVWRAAKLATGDGGSTPVDVVGCARAGDVQLQQAGD
jgi:adenylate cyclase